MKMSSRIIWYPIAGAIVLLAILWGGLGLPPSGKQSGPYQRTVVALEAMYSDAVATATSVANDKPYKGTAEARKTQISDLKTKTDEPETQTAGS